MEQSKLYPLKFDPIYQYRIWGGRRLNDLLKKPLPPNDPIGEAWILSDRADHASEVTEGELKGHTLTQLMKDEAAGLLGKYAGKFEKFPLLLKFLDCQKVLSVQVHPADDLTKYIPKGDSGKTESWVVLETGKDAVIYAGLKPGTTKETILEGLTNKTVGDELATIKPKIGDAVLITAGTVHTLNDVIVFECQENSDSTYRLYDWDRVDQKTGKPRDLQVDEALACINYSRINVQPVTPEIIVSERVLEEKVIEDPHFTIWRYTGPNEFEVGMKDIPRVLVSISGKGNIKYNGSDYSLSKGEVMILPAICGVCKYVPNGEVILLEIALPENAPPIN